MTMLLSPEILMEPYWELYINGNPLDDSLKRYVTSVEFEESDSEADLLRFTVSDVDFLFQNILAIRKGTKVKAILGHVKQHRLMFDGFVTHIEADFSEDGIPYLTFGAIDNTDVLTATKKSRVWKNRKKSEVVKEVVMEYGFRADVQDTVVVEEQITQDDETDAQLIARLADEELFKFYLITESNTIFFGDTATSFVSEDTLYYKKGEQTIRSFRPNFVMKEKELNKDAGISAQTGQDTIADSESSPSTQSSLTKDKSYPVIGLADGAMMTTTTKNYFNRFTPVDIE